MIFNNHIDGLYGEEEHLVLQMKAKEITQAFKLAIYCEKNNISIPDFITDDDLIAWYQKYGNK
jgi:hypothetical protein